MTCPEIQDLLDDYVDGALAEGEFQEVELHLHGCDGCRRQERALRSLLAQAEALGKGLDPPRDLWPGIAARLGPRSAWDRVSGFGGTRLAWASLAAAAATILAVSLLVRHGAGTRPPVAPTLTPVAVKSETVDPAEQEYVRATAELMTALAGKKDGLAPETQKAVDDNLRVIDGALRDLRQALQKDPGNQHLNKMLVATHQKKVDMLRFLLKLNLPQGERQS
jgi:hypothetical protein